MTMVSTLSTIIARRWFLSLIGLLLFIVMALGLHYRSFSAPMYYDSLTQLEGKQHIFASGDVTKVIRIFPQRPAAMATFYFNYLIWGMNPFYFRLVNAVLLAIMALISTKAIILILRTVAAEGRKPITVDSKAIPAGQVVSLTNAGPEPGAGTGGRKKSKGKKSSCQRNSVKNENSMAERPTSPGLETTSPVSPQGKEELGRIQIIALFLGLLYLIHPVQTYFVAYIWQRMALLSCLFYLASLYVYLATRAGKIRYMALGYLMSAVFFALALTSKENAVTLPAVLLLAEVAFFRTSWQGILKRAAAFSVIVILVLLPLSFLETPHGAGTQPPGIFATLAKYYQESGVTLFQVVISQCRVLFSYLTLILVPVSANVRFAAAHIIPGSPFESPATILAILGAIALATGGIHLLRRRPLTGFGLLFFLINLMPEAFLVPQYSFFAYRAILPMFGLLLVLADGVLEVLNRIEAVAWRPAYSRVTAITAMLVIVAIGAVTVSRAELWQDPVLFWQDIVDGFPSDKTNFEKLVITHALGNLGAALQKQNKNEEAVAALHKAVSVDPRSYTSYWLLGVVCDKIGDAEQAESALKKSIELEPRYVAAQFTLGDLYLAHDRVPEAWAHMRVAANLAPDDSRCLNGLGMILLRRDNPAEAASYFRKAIELTPGYDQAHCGLGEALAGMNMNEDALVEYRKAIALKQDNWRAHYNMGLVLAKSGNSEEAIMHFRTALAINPSHWSAHNNLGVLLAKSGHFREAATHFEETLKLHPDAAGAQKNLERVRYLLGTSR